MIENQESEFKREYTDEIKKSVIAFLNTNDGTVYVGIDNDGNVVGVDDPDDVMKKLSLSIKNGIRPDCSQFFNIKTALNDGKYIVQVNVIKGSHRPYYLGEKGVKPSGVFIRVGSTTVQAQEEKIRELIKKDDGDSFETRVARRQDLTFSYADNVFSEKKIDFTDNKKRTLGLLDENGFYTNLALLLSDQCEHTIKCAIFEGTTKEVFKDRKEFGGSLFKQLDDVLAYLNVYNRNFSTIGGKTRSDEREYPEAVLREAVLNAIIHRDYSYSGSILVNLYDDRIEIMSLGGLVDGLSKSVILAGVSETRNKKLADVFYRLQYVEAYGTGIPRIMENYSDTFMKPDIALFDGAFEITLPNKLYSAPKAAACLIEVQTAKILSLFEKSEFITKEDAATVLSVQPARAYVILEKLTKGNVLSCDKQGKKKVYFKK